METEGADFKELTGKEIQVSKNDGSGESIAYTIVELSVDTDRLFPRPYQEYLLNVINGNSDELFFSYEYITKTPLDQKDLFKIAEHQLEDIKIEDVNCFDTVRLLEKRGNVLELNCSNSFWIICRNSEAVFQYNNPDGTLEIIKVGV